MEAFNDQDGRRFYPDSTDGIFYWPWVMPEKRESLEESFMRKVLKLYLTHLKESRCGEMKVDSSNPSRVRAQSRLGVARKKFTVVKNVKCTSEFRDRMPAFHAGIADDY